MFCLLALVSACASPSVDAVASAPPPPPVPAAAPPPSPPALQLLETVRIDGICEASGAAWSAGTILLADDDIDGELRTFRPSEVRDGKGVASSGRSLAGVKLTDIEGLALGEGMTLWVSASGSTNKEGTYKEKRSRLTRWDPTGRLISVSPLRAQGEWPAQLEAAAAAAGTPVPAGGGDTFNLEGVALVGAGEAQRAYLGLRAPAVGGRALVVRVPVSGDVTVLGVEALDLGGRVVRDLVAAGADVLVLAGPADDGVVGEEAFALYRWRPDGNAPPERLGFLPSEVGAAPEALAYVPSLGAGSRPELWVFRDEGDRITAETVELRKSWLGRDGCAKIEDCEWSCLQTELQPYAHVTGYRYALP